MRSVIAKSVAPNQKRAKLSIKPRKRPLIFFLKYGLPLSNKNPARAHDFPVLPDGRQESPLAVQNHNEVGFDTFTISLEATLSKQSTYACVYCVRWMYGVHNIFFLFSTYNILSKLYYVKRTVFLRLRSIFLFSTLSLSLLHSHTRIFLQTKRAQKIHERTKRRKKLPTHRGRVCEPEFETWHSGFVSCVFARDCAPLSIIARLPVMNFIHT